MATQTFTRATAPLDEALVDILRGVMPTNAWYLHPYDAGAGQIAIEFDGTWTGGLIGAVQSAIATAPVDTLRERAKRAAQAQADGGLEVRALLRVIGDLHSLDDAAMRTRYDAAVDAINGS